MESLVVLVTVAVAAGVPSALVLHRAIARYRRDGVAFSGVLVRTSVIIGIIWLPGWAALFHVAGELLLAPVVIPVAAPLAVLLGFLLIHPNRVRLPSGEVEDSYDWFSYRCAETAILLGGYLPQLAVLLAEVGI